MVAGRGEKGRVTALVVNFNAGPLLRRCIDSLLKVPSVEKIIVSDNGSVDRSLEALPASPRLEILRHGKNLGFAAANNQALEKAESDYLLFLNPDAVVSADAIDAMRRFMDDNADVGMAGPLILNEDGSEQRGCRRDEPTPLAALKTLIGKREQGINKVGQPLPDGPSDVDAISGAFMFVRRAALEEVGPFDEGYFLHCEDLDWCKRFWQAGWRVVFLPDVVITHAKGGSSRNRMVRVEWHKHRGMLRYYDKFHRTQYPAIVMAAVRVAVWGRFLLLAPIWRWRSRRR